MRIRGWLGGLLLTATLIASADEPKREPVTADDVQAAIRDLGSDSFFVREAAMRRLWEAGPDAAGNALRKAARDGEGEVVLRARRVLSYFRHGIVPGTSREVVALIERYRRGNASERITVFRDLVNRGLTQPLVALLEGESNEQTRRQLLQVVTPAVRSKLPELLAAGKFDEADRWFQLSTLVGQGADAERDYAVYLMLRGLIDTRIDEDRRLIEAGGTAAQHRRLATLLMIAGDLPAARKQAELASDARAKTELALRSGDWDALSEPGFVPGDPGVEQLGFRTVFLQYAGREADADTVADSLLELAKNESHRAWTCGEALAIAGRWEDADRVYAATSEQAAFELRCARQQFSKAFEGIGLKPDASDALAWFRKKMAEAGENEQRRSAAFVWSTRLGRELYRTRGTGAVRELFVEARTVASGPNVSWRSTLAKVEAELGLDAEARMDVAAVLKASSQRLDPLDTLFDDREREARLWWRFRRTTESDEPIPATIDWIARVLGTGPESLDSDAFGAVVSAAEERAIEFAKVQRVDWLQTLAETCLARGDRGRAARLFESAAKSGTNPEPLLRRGDVAKLEGDWSLAAKWYQDAWARRRSDALPLYLAGLMQRRAGADERGDELITLARLTPLADANRRKAVADGLSERGFAAEARREWEFVTRTAAQSSWEGEQAWAVQVSFAQLANAIDDEDGLRAADCWRRYMLYLLKTNAAYTELRRYVVFAHLEHRVRTLALVKRDRIDEALAETDRALAAWPGEIEIVLQLVPELDRRGARERADALFERVFRFNAELCDTYPESGHLHNQLAWLSAKCNRRLASAIEHANRAVELEPNSAAFLDTLAEAHFVNGDRDRARELAARCVELDPNGDHYREQLERFSAAE